MLKSFADERLTWTPSRSKEEDVDANKGDLGTNSGGVILTQSAFGDTNDADEEFTNEHANSTPYENCAPTHPLNDVERNGSGANVDKGRDETDQEGIVNCLQLLEEGGTEVEDEVDSGPSVGIGN